MRCTAGQSRDTVGRGVHARVVTSFGKRSLGMLDDIPAVAEEASGAGEQLDGGGPAAVLSRLCGLWEAAPCGAGDGYRGIVVSAHLNDGPYNPALARGAPLDA